MKNLLLTLCFVFITSLLFCQTPNPQNIQIHFKNYLHNCVSPSLINESKKVVGDETEISQYKSLLHIAADYNRFTDYSIACSIGQNTWHKTIPVVMPWRCLDGSMKGPGFRGGYSIIIGVKKNYSLLDGHRFKNTRRNKHQDRFSVLMQAISISLYSYFLALIPTFYFLF